ncbi:hypothetical protein [Demequina litorisediminis]|uniref:hypothetical protein n=1 Tax=Demequina litorisediminis TaxID=1849022 RepID=UPI0024E18CF4|nr:hypothetical protein [Demequina litorisediminis]
MTNTLPTDLFDEQGTATATVTIPADAEGETVLTVEGDVTGTSFPIALTVEGAEPVERVCKVSYDIHGQWPGGFISQAVDHQHR